ncbi:MAG: iron-sulfur cluster assembly scaffold protein [Candidatus Pacebacteria bacterium]|jgi:nitrogen fixation protein NifU and related proteins|nr:iron-sulfur cluster assembly scaffold protein [Candidatus Paceibacterota bacterium]MBT3511498.1 iron-sulfur cluster assembly scaffold protein [Candidatus Paceibacterota bacterium]MBT4004650.1 iron-sulfur cluster assembly scaffold protein [Candidatus Paceibacterota bacterium]MBT4358432.1 iron-sulfur cluster assembly scaffold protein [Candidatus Paceibacterota bacterium]MBT4681052.1 iron-sulfur cluster assembly scaffold protein [Candidatus Paceibacterota bacterium]
MSDDLYRETIVTEARHPQNYGPLEGADINQSYVNPSCGDSINVYVKLDSAKKKIIDLGWEGNGCVVSMASMSFLSAKVKGMSLEEVNQLTSDDLQRILGVEEITPSREKCMMMGLMAIQKAVSVDSSVK